MRSKIQRSNRSAWPLALAVVVAATSGCALHGHSAHVAEPGSSSAAGQAAVGGVGDVTVSDVESSWDSIDALFFGSVTAAPYSMDSMYVLRGNVQNRGRRAMQRVVLRYELLDAAGRVVHVEEGYNRRAENFGDGSGRDGDIEPLGPGDSDRFRMVFFGDEVPRFATHRVSVIEAVAAQ